MCSPVTQCFGRESTAVDSRLMHTAIVRTQEECGAVVIHAFLCGYSRTLRISIVQYRSEFLKVIS